MDFRLTAGHAGMSAFLADIKNLPGPDELGWKKIDRHATGMST